MIPEGWQRTTIGAHVDVLTGYAFKSSDYSSGPDDIRLLRGDNVAQHRIRWRDAQKLPQEKARGLDRFALRLGDFVIALDRTWIPAGVKIAEIAEADLPSLLVQRVARLRSKPSLEQSLMRQYFSGHGFEQYVKSVQTETAVPHISPNDLRDLAILLPPLLEQKRMAETLETWDRAIETVEALIANARAQKQALMQQLLPQGTIAPKKRLPGFAGEWREAEFNEVFDLKIGGTPARNNPAHWDGDKATQNRWIAISDLQGKYIDATREHISDEGVQNSNVKALASGTVIFSFKLSIGRKAILRKSAYTNEAICALIPKRPEELSNLFVFHALELVDFTASTDQAVKGATLNKAKIADLYLSFPPRAEQDHLVEVLEAADVEIAILQAQLTALRQEKAALMQQLLTGKRRVKLPECEVA